jgi:peptidoglycan/xylan/chitin deacetylase (PgdA/CDA1 family)
MDGVNDDIRLIEILRKHRATASFNLNAGNHRNERYGGAKFKGTKEVYEGFTVASHTLTKIPLDQARREIFEDRDALKQLFGYPIEGFAYPYGDQNAEVHALIREAGHLYARSSRRRIPRISVRVAVFSRPISGRNSKRCAPTSPSSISGAIVMSS